MDKTILLGDLTALRPSHPGVTDFLTGKFVIAGTGHRPDKLGGFSLEALEALIEVARGYLLKLRPDVVITGMALGWDTALAAAALGLRIPYVAALPFPRQASRWPQLDQERHLGLLKRAALVVCVGSDDLADADIRSAMQWRNEFMVDHAHLLLACFDGSAGGTAGCVKDAVEQGKTVVNTYRKWEEVTRPMQAEQVVPTATVHHPEFGSGVLRGKTEMKHGPCLIVDFERCTAIVPEASVRGQVRAALEEDLPQIVHPKFGEGTVLQKVVTVLGEMTRVSFEIGTRTLLTPTERPTSHPLRERAPNPLAFEIGQQVAHPIYGRGDILAVSSTALGEAATVAFPSSTQKLLMTSLQPV
ncbi:hypothetical protein DAETH_47440 (plasmid) [Deinococcus aetherius]|uniref:DUF1273 domain-containing protein n=1 Tax=Deinococcus aetherius TaxID=200252 RepID=A0ABM8ALQ7_9DEIO|nr:hypothetical protein [Deinococcus aetherius]BDP44775.1 hypothetical protein DAETH_47440 [Deinococcus aetherius]